MGRPSKLSDQQRADVRKRLLAGEKPSAIAADLGVHKSQISRCGVAPLKKEREIATQLVNAEVALRELPLIQQLNVLQLADEYRSTVVSMATAGKLGAMTAARLSSMAHSIVTHIERDEHGRPKNSAMEPLRTAAGRCPIRRCAKSSRRPTRWAASG